MEAEEKLNKFVENLDVWQNIYQENTVKISDLVKYYSCTLLISNTIWWVNLQSSANQDKNTMVTFLSMGIIFPLLTILFDIIHYFYRMLSWYGFWKKNYKYYYTIKNSTEDYIIPKNLDEQKLNIINFLFYVKVGLLFASYLILALVVCYTFL